MVKIQFRRSGGLRGATKKMLLDTSLLPASEERDILNKLANIKMEHGSIAKDKNEMGADYYTYTIIIEDDNNRHTIEINDLELKSDNLVAPLIEALNEKICDDSC